MPLLRKLCLSATAALIVGSAAAVAQDNFRFPVKARQGQMAHLAVNLGVIGAMAKGEMDYNAELAQAAADNIVAISMLNSMTVWPEGSDSESYEGTRAKPSVWADRADYDAKWGDLGSAALALQAAAGSGQEALGPALGGVGKSCQSCHETHQVPRN